MRSRIVLQSQSLAQQLEDPAKWIERLPFGEAREGLAIEVVIHNHPSLKERLAALSELEGVDHDRLIGNMVKSSILDYPEIAANVDTWKGLPVETRSSIVRSTIGMAFNQSPSEAASWLWGLPPGVAEPSHFSKLWERWASIDPEASSSELQNLDPGPLRDGAIRGLAERISFGRNVVVPDYQAAWHWAKTMGVVDQRDSLLSEIEQAWRSNAPEAVDQFLEDER